jgi:hypothetical protein
MSIKYESKYSSISIEDRIDWDNPTWKNGQLNACCQKCGIKLSENMGYVCNDEKCALGSPSSVIWDNSITYNLIP